MSEGQDSRVALPEKLRPEKVRGALERRWFEWRLSHTERRELAGLVHLGSAYGGWLVPGGPIDSTWICYSVGAGGDVSFDLELIERFGVTVRAFEAVADFVAAAEKDGAGEPRFSAHHAAIAASDGPIRMQVNDDRRSRSVSSAGLYLSHDYVELPGRTLASLMRELGDERIDLLKLDIEGGEYELLPGLDLRAMGVKVFAVQLHRVGTVREARALIARLRERGYELVACRSVVKLTFVSSELLDGPPGPRAAI